MSIDRWLKTYSRRRAVRIVTLCGALAAGQAATAADVVWQGDDSNDWATADNWDTSLVPTAGDNAILDNGIGAEIAADVGTVDNVFISGDTEVSLAIDGLLGVTGSFIAGSDAGSTGSVVQTGGDLVVDTEFIIGDLGDATYNIIGGTATVGGAGTGTALIGSFDATGELNLSGDGEVAFNSLLVIRGGAINQSGGAMTVIAPDGDALIGAGVDGAGALNLSDGVAIVDSFAILGALGSTNGLLDVSGGEFSAGVALQAGGESITDPESDFFGLPTAGQVVQSAGSVVVNQLQIAPGAASTGSYEMQAGTLEVQDASFFGVPSFEFETGVLTQSNATYTQSGGDALFLAPMFIGEEGKANVTVSDGTFTVDTPVPPAGQQFPSLALGVGATGEAEFNIEGGDVTLDEAVLLVGSVKGELNQSGGTLLINPAEPPPGFFTPTLWVGFLDSGNGVANFSGGEANFTNTVLIGQAGNATMNQTGGVVNVATTSDPAFIVPAMIVGTTPNKEAVLNLTGGTTEMVTALIVGDASGVKGTVNIGGTAQVSIGEEFLVGGFVGADDLNGEVNQSGGEVTVGLNLLLGLQRVGADVASGVYNMSGGVLNLPGIAIVGETGDGVFRQTGGVVNSLDSIGLANSAGSNGTYILEGGTLELNQQGLLIGDGTPSLEFTGGRLSGAALIDLPVTQTGGVLSTGAVPFATQITGDYAISGDGALEIKLGGLTPVDEHDFIQVDGAATLGGTLSVLLTNDFTPQIGDIFEILASGANTIVGEFDNLTFEANPGNLTGQLIYESDRVLLEIIQGAAGQIGDTDNDGDVDLDDLNAVRNNFGGTTGGDTFPFDGQVDLDDLNAVRNNFGAGGSPATGETDTSGVPHTHVDATYLRDGLNYAPRPRAAMLDRDLVASGEMLSNGTSAVPEPSGLALGALSVLAGAVVACRRRGGR